LTGFTNNGQTAVPFFSFPSMVYTPQQGRIQPVNLGGMISVILGSQVSIADSLL